MYGGTKVDRALCLMTAIWCMDALLDRQPDYRSGADTSALLTDDPGDIVLSSLQLLDDCNRSAIQQRVAVVDS